MSPSAPGSFAGGRNRVVVRGVHPEVDAGRFPAKATLGDPVFVEADVFTDGHDEVSCEVLWRKGRASDDAPDSDWQAAPMAFVVNDRWRGSFYVSELTHYTFTVRGWVDHFKTWVHDLRKRVDAGQDVHVDLLIGADIIERSAERAEGEDGDRLWGYVKLLRNGASQEERWAAAFTEELRVLVDRYSPKANATTYERELEVVVDRERAAFSSWYELFPRSASPDPDRAGTLQDVIDRLPYVAGLGFDVLYLPPIHPIGRTARKGRDNHPEAEASDVGSPWAIGSEEGGHKAVHPDLGTVEDLERLVQVARDDHGLEVALDIAFQCSPDHPYVHEHPEWFRKRPDGTIQYAENPPKRYQDIYPFDFESDAWESLWLELKSIFDFWIGHGVRIFRVDNPHTKAFPFWEWCIAAIREEHPDVLFLSEAFTRPKVMERLAKLGFSQSYTYFAWRTDAWNLREYFAYLTDEAGHFFRPNAWPNTPDILTEQLQTGGRAAYVSRLILAATLCSNYGIYGPPFELMESEPARPGSEEYRHSEKYEIRHWDLDREGSLAPMIRIVNRIRRENPALHRDRNLRFHPVDNDALLAYSKATDDHSNVILCIVNTDLNWTQSGWVHLDLDSLGLVQGQPYEVRDLVTGSRYQWQDSANFVELNPHVLPGHVFRVHAHPRDERDFPTF